MGLGCGTTFVKYVLFVFNFLIAVSELIHLSLLLPTNESNSCEERRRMDRIGRKWKKCVSVVPCVTKIVVDSTGIVTDSGGEGGEHTLKPRSETGIFVFSLCVQAAT